MKKGVIFDVDGTLWDALDQLTDSWNKTASSFSFIHSTLDKEEVRKRLGKTKEDFYDLLGDIPREQAEEVMEACIREQDVYLREHPGRIYPGMRQVLEQLGEKYSLYIVSNCQEGYIENMLSTCGLEEFFEDYECHGRTGKSKGRNIRILMERCGIDKAVYIGDTEMDEEATIEAEVPFVYAEYGFGNVERARYVAKQPSDIPAAIEKMKYFSL